jgi:hypothetical protein
LGQQLSVQVTVVATAGRRRGAFMAVGASYAHSNTRGGLFGAAVLAQVTEAVTEAEVVDRTLSQE